MREPVQLKLDTGLELAGEAAVQVAATVWLPDDPMLARALLVCLPGGNMNRHYYDLRPPLQSGGGDLTPDESDDTFSFAAQMTARGFIVAALDHLGLGDSTKPQDGWQLTPDVLVRANAAATRHLQARLHAGRLAPGVAALPALPSIGVGHSMGAMLTILQQHAESSHAAIVLLGFSTRGLPEYLPPALKAVTDPLGVRPQLLEHARKMFGQPYPVIHGQGGGNGNNAELFGSRKADPRGIKALKRATDCVLPVPAVMSMIPGNVAPEAAALDLPVFLGIGERDMVGPPHQVPAAFAASRDITLYLLAETGHSHFLFPARTALFDRIASWSDAIL